MPRRNEDCHECGGMPAHLRRPWAAAGPGRAAHGASSRTGHRNMATLKPTTPLLTPNKGPLKPASPLRLKTAPQTAISHPQRRRRFQSHTDTSEQRQRRFQTSRPPRQQGQAAVPAGGGGAWPGFEPTGPVTRQHTRRRRCGGCRRDLPPCRWAVARPGRASRRSAQPRARMPDAAGGRRRDRRPWLRRPWAVAGLGQASRRGAERIEDA